MFEKGEKDALISSPERASEVKSCEVRLQLWDLLLQNLAVGGLRVTKVHQLIHQLIYDDKVISNAFFLQLFEILWKHLQKTKSGFKICYNSVPVNMWFSRAKNTESYSYLDNFIQEGENQRDTGIFLGCCNHWCDFG